MTGVSRRTVMAGGVAALSAPIVSNPVLASELSAPVATLPGEWWWAGPKYGVLDEGRASGFLTLRRVGHRREWTLSRRTMEAGLWDQCVPGARFRFERRPMTFRDALEFQPADHPAAVAGRLAADRLTVACGKWALFWKGGQERDGAFNAFRVGGDLCRFSYPGTPSLGLMSEGFDCALWMVRYGWSWHGPLVVEAHVASDAEVRHMSEVIGRELRMMGPIGSRSDIGNAAF